MDIKAIKFPTKHNEVISTMCHGVRLALLQVSKPETVFPRSSCRSLVRWGLGLVALALEYWNLDTGTLAGLSDLVQIRTYTPK